MKLRSLLLPLLLGACLAACSGPSAEAPKNAELAQLPATEALLPTPESIRALIAEKGAKAAVGELSGNDEHWTHVTRLIATGDDKWLAIVAPLAPGLSGETAKKVDASLSEALPANPETVLGFVSAERPVSTLCFYKGTLWFSSLAVAAWKEASTLGVSAIADPAFASRKAQCLATIATVSPERSPY